MHSRSLLPSKSLLGIFAMVAISIAVAGVSVHDHALDDGAEAHSRVCVVAGTAVLPTTDVPASVSDTPLLARIEEPHAAPILACDGDRRPPRARGPPAIEFRTT